MIVSAMTRSANVLREALQLSPRERAEVAEELLASLVTEPVEPGDDVAQAWGAEIERRARRALAGESPGIPWHEVRKSIESLLKAP
jgi:putative addiction module component (TIGR02574 family)